MKLKELRVKLGEKRHYTTQQIKQAYGILNDPIRIDVTATNSIAKDISQTLYYVPKRRKIELCLHILRNEIKGNILIFRRTKFACL